MVGSEWVDVRLLVILLYFLTLLRLGYLMVDKVI